MKYMFHRLGRKTLLVAALLSAALSPATRAAVIVNISLPYGTMDGTWANSSGVYSEAPGPGALGIGRIVDPAHDGYFSLHDHSYIAPHVPNPGESVVTYQFDTPAIVTGLELGVHANGISMIEALVGDSLGSLTSLGIFTGSLGAPHGSVSFAEHALNTFSFGNTTAALYFQFVVTETTLSDGYANYHAIPEFHDPAPATVPDALGFPTVAVTLLGLGALRRRVGLA